MKNFDSISLSYSCTRNHTIFVFMLFGRTLYFCTNDICLITSGCDGIWLKWRTKLFPDHVYRIKRNALMLPYRRSFSLFQRDESRRKNKRKLHSVYRVLRAIHTDVIPTRTIPWPSEGRKKFPIRIVQRDTAGFQPLLFHICMHVGNSTLRAFSPVPETGHSVVRLENLPRINLFLGVTSFNTKNTERHMVLQHADNTVFL